jgi:hypothetical protein
VADDTTKPSGRIRSGFARAAALSPEQRREIARGAAISRWTKDLPRAIATGDLKIGDANIACAVLDDEKNTRVLTQDGFLVAIGRSKRPNSSAATVLDEKPAFLRAANLQPFVINNIRCSTTPIRFRPLKGGGTEGLALGYEADMLPEVCWVYHEAAAAKKLLPSQKHIADYCSILLRGLTNVAITSLVDEATGYQDVRDRNALQEILDKYLRRDLAAWAKRFPDDFYKQIFRLRKWQWRGMKVNRPQVVAHYTMDLVWSRLAPGILVEMERRMPRDDLGRRKGRLAQLLTDDYGIPELKSHFDVLIALMMTQPNWDAFMRAIDVARPKIGTNFQLPFVDENVR